MTTEHITAGLTNHVALRHSHQVLPETLAHFRPCIRPGTPVPIPETPFLLRSTALDGSCAFDLIHGLMPIFVNIGCWNPAKREEVIDAVRGLQQRLPHQSTLRLPERDSFLYSVMLFPAPPDVMQLAGEIEFYIYETIRLYGYFSEPAR